MAQVNQVYTIVNTLAKQMYGAEAPAVTDAKGLVALGDMVLSSDKDKSLFTSTLVDRIALTIFSNMREYDTGDTNILRLGWEYGFIVQKIYVELPPAEKNNSWEIGQVDYKPSWAPVIKPSLKQKLFSNVSTFEIPFTIPDYLWKTAFTNAADMARLIDAVFSAQRKSAISMLEGMVNLCRACFMARKLQANKPCGAVNLLKLYNDATGAGLSADKCLTNKEFLRFAAVEVRKWTKRMRRMSVLFNDEGYTRFTPANNLVLTLHDDFDAALVGYLESDTYHDDLVRLTNYSTVPYWQYSGENYAFADTSAINVTIEDDKTVNVSGIIGVAYDYDAMAVLMETRNVTSERNNHDEYTNYYFKYNRGLMNDMSENGIVFYVAEEDYTPVILNSLNNPIIRKKK